MEEDVYNELFDTIEYLNNESDRNIILGIRDTNWVTPKRTQMPWYECEIILSDGKEEIFQNKYRSQEAGEAEFALGILLTEALDALNIYKQTYE